MATFDERKPTSSSGGVSANMDATRANLIYLRECLAARGDMPGYEIASGSDITYNVAKQPTVTVFKERTGIATANGRASGTRYFFRETNTYNGSGQLTKSFYEYSANSGSTWNNWVDAEGNAADNFTYNGDGTLATFTRSAS